jgi:hypothetical protein
MSSCELLPTDGGRRLNRCGQPNCAVCGRSLIGRTVTRRWRRAIDHRPELGVVGREKKRTTSTAGDQSLLAANEATRCRTILNHGCVEYEAKYVSSKLIVSPDRWNTKLSPARSRQGPMICHGPFLSAEHS